MAHAACEALAMPLCGHSLAATQSMPAGAAHTEGHGLAVWRPNACWERGEGDVSLHKEAVAWVWRVLQGALDPSTTVVPPGWPGAVCSASCGSQGASSSTDHGCSSRRRRLGTKKGVRPERQSVPCGVFCVLTAVCDSKAVSLWLCKALIVFRGPFMRRAFSSAGVRNSGPHGSVE